MNIYCDEEGCYVSGRELMLELRGTAPNGDMQQCLAKLGLTANRDYVIRKNDVDVRIEPLLRELEAIFPVFRHELRREYVRQQRADDRGQRTDGQKTDGLNV